MQEYFLFINYQRSIIIRIIQSLLAIDESIVVMPISWQLNYFCPSKVGARVQVIVGARF